MKKTVPSPLFEADGRLTSSVRRRMRAHDRIALFLDYDGTLTPIAPTPEQAVLSRRAFALLHALTLRPDVRIAIVTGRSPDQLRRVLPPLAVDIAVNHGLQIVCGRNRWMHPGAVPLVPVIHTLHGLLRRRMKDMPGLLLEDKGCVLGIHLRGVRKDRIPSVRSTVRDLIRPRLTGLRMTTGKLVMEVRPAMPWTKGDAILRLLSDVRYAGMFPVFIGDDRTDEDGFTALRGIGLTIRVGRSLRTRARFVVPGVDGVLRFLEEIDRKSPTLPGIEAPGEKGGSSC